MDNRSKPAGNTPPSGGDKPAAAEPKLEQQEEEPKLRQATVPVAPASTTPAGEEQQEMEGEEDEQEQKQASNPVTDQAQTVVATRNRTRRSRRPPPDYVFPVPSPIELAMARDFTRRREERKKRAEQQKAKKLQDAAAAAAAKQRKMEEEEKRAKLVTVTKHSTTSKPAKTVPSTAKRAKKLKAIVKKDRKTNNRFEPLAKDEPADEESDETTEESSMSVQKPVRHRHAKTTSAPRYVERTIVPRAEQRRGAIEATPIESEPIANRTRRSLKRRLEGDGRQQLKLDKIAKHDELTNTLSEAVFSTIRRIEAGEQLREEAERLMQEADKKAVIDDVIAADAQRGAVRVNMMSFFTGHGDDGDDEDEERRRKRWEDERKKEYGSRSQAVNEEEEETKEERDERLRLDPRSPPRLRSLLEQAKREREPAPPGFFGRTLAWLSGRQVAPPPPPAAVPARTRPRPSFRAPPAKPARFQPPKTPRFQMPRQPPAAECMIPSRQQPAAAEQQQPDSSSAIDDDDWQVAAALAAHQDARRDSRMSQWMERLSTPSGRHFPLDGEHLRIGAALAAGQDARRAARMSELMDGLATPSGRRHQLPNRRAMWRESVEEDSSDEEDEEMTPIEEDVAEECERASQGSPDEDELVRLMIGPGGDWMRRRAEELRRREEQAAAAAAAAAASAANALGSSSPDMAAVAAAINGAVQAAAAAEDAAAVEPAAEVEAPAEEDNMLVGPNGDDFEEALDDRDVVIEEEENGGCHRCLPVQLENRRLKALLRRKDAELEEKQDELRAALAAEAEARDQFCMAEDEGAQMSAELVRVKRENAAKDAELERMRRLLAAAPAAPAAAAAPQPPAAAAVSRVTQLTSMAQSLKRSAFTAPVARIPKLEIAKMDKETARIARSLIGMNSWSLKRTETVSDKLDECTPSLIQKKPRTAEAALSMVALFYRKQRKLVQAQSQLAQRIHMATLNVLPGSKLAARPRWLNQHAQITMRNERLKQVASALAALNIC